LPQYIESAGNDIFLKLKSQKFFIGLDHEEAVEALVSLFADMNALHPFREGNGRTQREFIEELSKICGVNLDLTAASSFDMIVASHDSTNGDFITLREMFRRCAKKLSKLEQKQYIELYCTDTLKKDLLEQLR